MTARELLRRARELGLTLTPEGDRLRVKGPDSPEARELLRELRVHKAELLHLLKLPRPVSPLAAYALELGARAPLKFTLRESEDEAEDSRLMAKVKAIIDEFPGQDAIVMTVVTLEGRRRRFLWRAESSKGLRFALAALLRERALSQRALLPPHGLAYCPRCGAKADVLRSGRRAHCPRCLKVFPCRGEAI
jgi:hypothetical protein